MSHPPHSILVVGASRGLGHAIAAEFLKKDWKVMGTVRGTARTLLHDLADAHPGRVEIESLDITDPGQIQALRERLAGGRFDILFVNAGTTNPDPTQTIGEVSTEDFVNLMVANALSPMRVVESLAGNVPPDGLIGVMSSGQGSIADNETGQREVYRGSKAALNVAAQFRRAPGGNAACPAGDGARLGAHRAGRARGPADDRAERAEPGRSDAREAWAARARVPGLPGAHGGVVRRVRRARVARCLR